MYNQVRPRAVIFDMGGTLEEVTKEQETEVRGATMLTALLTDDGVLRTPMEPRQLLHTVEQALEEYKAWSMRNGNPELAPEEIWSKWILTTDEFDTSKLSAQTAEHLSFIYETQCLKRQLRPDAIAVLEKLSAEGFLLAVISNSISRTQVPYTLRTNNLERFFPVVEISCVAGYRKPSPVMFRNAAHRLGVTCSQCAYVGDTYSRDVLGARASGYGYVFWMQTSQGQRPAEYTAHRLSPNTAGNGQTQAEKVSSITEVYQFLMELPHSREAGTI